jgi:hypothetical protein
MTILDRLGACLISAIRLEWRKPILQILKSRLI